jgi:hypothetical protein
LTAVVTGGRSGRYRVTTNTCALADSLCWIDTRAEWGIAEPTGQRWRANAEPKTLARAHPVGPAVNTVSIGLPLCSQRPVRERLAATVEGAAFGGVGQLLLAACDGLLSEVRTHAVVVDIRAARLSPALWTQLQLTTTLVKRKIIKILGKIPNLCARLPDAATLNLSSDLVERGSINR